MTLPLNVLIYVLSAFFTGLQAVILWKIATNQIDLQYLISGENRTASLSRFQFLVFTFVIAAGFLYLTVKGAGFPKVDEGVLMLLGISGATYALGKSLETAKG